MSERIGFYLTDSVLPDFDGLTLCQIAAAANHRITILGMDLGIEGDTPASAPIIFDWSIQTNVGTTSSSITPQKQDRGYAEGIQGGFKTFLAANTEPTTGAALVQFSLHEQGFIQWRPPRPLIVGGGTWLGFRHNGTNYNNVTFTIYCEQ